MANNDKLAKIQNAIQEVEYEYWFDQKEFGKVMIIASLSLLVISLHAFYTVNDIAEKADNTTQRLEDTSVLVNSDVFQGSMNSLAATGVTIQGQEIQQIVADLEYAVGSVEGVESISSDIDRAQNTYQWLVLISILGLVTGITSLYI